MKVIEQPSCRQLLFVVYSFGWPKFGWQPQDVVKKHSGSWCCVNKLLNFSKILNFLFLAWVFNAKRFSTWDSIFLGTMLWISLFYIVGFIMMTPQLFINYKMKSVAHLPWRMMTYKALNTFIDDLFAFVIKMPTLYRLGCFRDGKDNYVTKNVQIINFFGTFIKVRNPEVLFCNSVKSL